MADKNYNIFIKSEIYPSALGILGFSPKSIEEIKEDCIFVIDTNALLIPYTIDSKSLEEIRSVYLNLRDQNRLLLPAQVVREFADNRPTKLKELHSALSKKMSSVQTLNFGKYPILERNGIYEEILTLEKEINAKLKQYRKLSNDLIKHIKGWSWNDPVSVIYKEIFTDDKIIELNTKQEDIQKDLENRLRHNIPPGFKDHKKDDMGVGDLIIWLTILQIASPGRNVIFISNDSKNDWFYQSENSSLYSRFELSHEFHRITNGGSFQMIKLSELLELFGVGQEVVENVRAEERLPEKLEGVDPIHKVYSTIVDYFVGMHEEINYSTPSHGIPTFLFDAPSVNEAAVQVIYTTTHRLTNDQIYVLNEFCGYASGIKGLTTYVVVVTRGNSFSNEDLEWLDELVKPSWLRITLIFGHLVSGHFIQDATSVA
ncbi:PIN domain-containing protein [Dyadobacter aurulentus]|uniref:PIN domain-containing protein n=1 Tax=Dyadobacter sp. UC 10 TaxID=2605428 RepID=UPI0011F1E9F1|nr:PIN domain-containing protein [Dyadobacter sp. UC 10]KAA0990902.1 hypothetical protein FXO21_12435 [Dyadobacter sp. UC 10]